MSNGDQNKKRPQPPSHTCENEGSSVGGTPCPNKATHRLIIWRGDDEYESFLCAECFIGFRDAMIKSGQVPENEKGTQFDA